MGTNVALTQVKSSVLAVMRPALFPRGAKLVAKWLLDYRTALMQRCLAIWRVAAVKLTLTLVSFAGTVLRRTARRQLAIVELRERKTLRSSQAEREKRAVLRFTVSQETFVVAVQSLARARQARTEMRRLSDADLAARAVQLSVRSHAAALALATLRLERAERISAAVLIQRHARGCQGRERFRAIQAASRAERVVVFIEHRALKRRENLQIAGAALVIQERWRKRMRMRRHHFTQERLRVRKANIICKSIARFNARAKRRHRRAAGIDVRLGSVQSLPVQVVDKPLR